MEFKHINPSELTVWHLDDQDRPRREIKRFVETELPQGVEHKECLGPRDFAISLAKAIKNGDLRKYNAFISDGAMCNDLSPENKGISLPESDALGLQYTMSIGVTDDDTKEILSRNQEVLTNDGRAFLYGYFAGSISDELRTKYDPSTAIEKLPLNTFNSLNKHFCIPKSEDLKENFTNFFSHFDNLVGLAQEA